MTGEEAIKKLQNRYAYNNKFNREKYDRITVMLPKGTKEEYKTQAKNKGFASLTQYIISLLDADR